MEEKLLLLGDQAIALGAIHAGLSGVYAYPGTPSTEITEYIQQAPLALERKIHSRWCTNEKTAMEAALGVSYVGKRALVCMKHVGLNVAADAFVNSAMTGTNGGVVVLVADDPSMHSSQNEQDSRFYSKFAMVPTLEPSSQQEAYDMMGYAYALSEEFQLPVLMRVTTRMAHSRAVVRVEAPQAQNELHFPEDLSRWVLLPAIARKRNLAVIAQQPQLEQRAAQSCYNRYQDGANRKRGVVACGIAYNYLMENFPGGCDFPVLKVSQYPLPKDLVCRMAEECEEILVMEEGQPFVEEQIRGVLPVSCRITGRLSGALPRTGELTPDNVKPALGLAAAKNFAPSENVVPRPPALCAGCGHRDVYEALNRVVREYKDHRGFSG
ncbi:MAG: indolepyruvate ferredoxin oxidoreductase, partial [Alistipes sp.]|nr:indolepyruvate ferredoxin oxidoreductase [Alistipes sp.]